MTLGDLVAWEEAEPAEELHVSLLSDALRSAVASLPELEHRVIELRYGIDDEEPQTVDQTMHRLGLRRAQVLEIEREALERLSVERELQALLDAA